jgi:Ran GTPase-activating protein (RanGAP) involved in mRNA processing and transport
MEVIVDTLQPKLSISSKVLETNLTNVGGPQFIETTRKNSKSPWVKIVNDQIERYSKKYADSGITLSKSTFDLDNFLLLDIDETDAQLVIAQLKKDFAIMDKYNQDSTEDLGSCENVSDLAIILPRPKGYADYGHLYGYKLAQLYFPPKDSSSEQKLNSRIRFGKFLANLSKFYNKISLKEFNKIHMFKQVRGSNAGYNDLWEQLKQRPISSNILAPTPMKVDIASKEDLEPFMTHLRSNKPIEENFHDKDRDNMCQKFTKGALYHDGRLDLCKQVVGPTHIKELMDSLRESDKVKHFLLGNNIINRTGAEEISAYIRDKKNIETWYLAGNEIDSDGIKLICEELVQDAVCKDLWLKRNPIGPKGSEYLRNLLIHNNTIETLDLCNTGLLDEGCINIFEGLIHNTSVKNLYLDSNGLTVSCIDSIEKYFAYLIKNNIYGIERLWLDINRFDDEGIERISRIVGKYQYIQVFFVSSNGITSKGIKTIYESFVSHPNLKALDIGMYKSTADLFELTNRIGDDGVEYLVKLIESNKVIEYLSFTHNGIGIEGIKKIAKSIESNDQLVHVEYVQYGTVISKDIKEIIGAKIEENIKRKNIKDIHSYSRFLRHTPTVVNIDSIYRNNSK